MRKICGLRVVVQIGQCFLARSAMVKSLLRNPQHVNHILVELGALVWLFMPIAGQALNII